MQHETATIKKIVKKYKTKDGAEKESISYHAKLNPDSEFKNGDKVAVAPLDIINELDNISADEIQQLKKDVADKDDIIAANTESIGKFKADIKEKSNIIASLSKENKETAKTVADLKSDISEKDNIIAELNSNIKISAAKISDLKNDVSGKDAELISIKNSLSEKDKSIVELTSKNEMLHEKLNELTDLLTDKDKTIDSLDETIVEYKVKIATYNAIDIDKLKKKSDELDNVKNELNDINIRLDKKSNVISLLQNQIMELQQLVNYKDKEIDAVKNQNVFYKLIGKDATADIIAPTLYLIDISGNLIKNDKSDINVDATDVSDDHADNDNSGKDRIFKI